MGLFGTSSAFDQDVEKATSETNTSEKWDLIIEICEKVGMNKVGIETLKSKDILAQNSKDCLKSITKRLNHADPHVVLQAITLLEACVKNCAPSFLLEVASRDFEQEFQKLILKHSKGHSKISEKLKLLLKGWAECEFKDDSQLSLIPALYRKLKHDGIDFNVQPDPTTMKTHQPLSNNPDAVHSQQEEDDIRKAIEASLKDSKQSYSKVQSTGLYPSTTTLVKGPSSVRNVRALYDFEAVEDNELTFRAGDIIQVLDDSDANWWKGQNQKHEGLFPANFVTSDLTAEPEEPPSSSKATKKIAFDDEVTVYKPAQIVEINETKIDRLIDLLHDADPQDASHDTTEMLDLEEQVNAMGPLIDTELEVVDKTHAQLTQLSTHLVEALNLYHTLMREPYQSGPTPQKSGYPAQPLPPTAMTMYNTNGLPSHQPYPHPSGNGPYPNMPPSVPTYMGHSMQYQPVAQPPMPNNNNPPMYAGVHPQFQHQQYSPHHQQNHMPPQQSGMVPPQPSSGMVPPQQGGMLPPQQGAVMAPPQQQGSNMPSQQQSGIVPQTMGGHQMSTPPQQSLNNQPPSMRPLSPHQHNLSNQLPPQHSLPNQQRPVGPPQQLPNPIQNNQPQQINLSNQHNNQSHQQHILQNSLPPVPQHIPGAPQYQGPPSMHQHPPMVPLLPQHHLPQQQSAQMPQL